MDAASLENKNIFYQFTIVLLLVIFFHQTKLYSQMRLDIVKFNQAQLSAAFVYVKIQEQGKALNNLNIFNYGININGKPARIYKIFSPDTLINTKTVLLLDLSAPTSSWEFESIKNSAKKFINGLSPADSCSIISFSSTVKVEQTFTNDSNLLLPAIDKLVQGNGCLLYDGLKLSLDLLLKQYGRKSILLFSVHENSSINFMTTYLDNALRNDNIVLNVIRINETVRQSTLKRLVFLSCGNYFNITDSTQLLYCVDSMKNEMLEPKSVIAFDLNPCGFDSLQYVQITAQSNDTTLIADTLLLSYYSHRYLSGKLNTPKFISYGQKFTATIKLSVFPHSFIVRNFTFYVSYDSNYMAPIRCTPIGMLKGYDLTMSPYLDSTIIIQGENVFFDASDTSKSFLELEFATGPNYPPPGRESIDIYAGLAHNGFASEDFRCFNVYPLFSEGFAQLIKICDCEQIITPTLKLISENMNQGTSSVGIFLDGMIERSLIYSGRIDLSYDTSIARLISFDIQNTGMQQASYYQYYYFKLSHSYSLLFKDAELSSSTTPLLIINFQYRKNRNYTILPINIEVVSLLQKCCYSSPLSISNIALDGTCEKIVTRKNTFRISASPNPFNSSTRINYRLQKDSQVELRVFDSFGRLKATVVNDVQLAGDQYVVFDGSRLSSGFYFYTLNVIDLASKGTIMLTNKFQLIK